MGGHECTTEKQRGKGVILYIERVYSVVKDVSIWFNFPVRAFAG